MSNQPALPAPQPFQRDPGAAPSDGRAPAAHPSPPGPLESARAPLRLLVVDDEPLVLRALHRLGERQGMVVLPAPDAVSALQLLRSGQAVDVALIDLVMPGLDGEALMEATLLLRPGVPVILMSGFAREARIERCLERGAVAFLRKPFGWPELQRALEACRSTGEADHHLWVR